MSAAGFIKEQWNGALTLRGIDFNFFSFRTISNFLTLSESPLTITCPPPLEEELLIAVLSKSTAVIFHVIPLGTVS